MLKFILNIFNPKKSAEQSEIISPDMKYLIVGLGNVGAEYAGTRHNIGFDILDRLAEELNASFKLENHAWVATAKYKGKSLTLVKPTTYMNLSGKAVKFWMDRLSIPREQILVVLDDLHLGLGQLRIRPNGSDAGHNGLKHIDQMLAGNNYSRLKFGIGNQFAKGRQSDFVLGKWSNEELKTVEEQMPKAVACIQSFCFAGLANTMSTYNKSESKP